MPTACADSATVRTSPTTSTSTSRRMPCTSRSPHAISPVDSPRTERICCRTSCSEPPPASPSTAGSGSTSSRPGRATSPRSESGWTYERARRASDDHRVSRRAAVGARRDRPPRRGRQRHRAAPAHDRPLPLRAVGYQALLRRHAQTRGLPHRGLMRRPPFRSALQAATRPARLLLVAKTALAVGIAWFIARYMPGVTDEYPYYAPLGALVSMYPTLMGSVKSG